MSTVSTNKPVQRLPAIRLRPLERDDLIFVHHLDNNHTIMRYWFEEPFETHDELITLYTAHIHDQRERRFIVEALPEKCTALPAAIAPTRIGLVELIEINLIHRRAEFQIIIAPDEQGRGYAKAATARAIQYAFDVLNLHKLYLVVDCDNLAGIHVYEGCGFLHEAILEREFFSHGAYRSVKRMRIFQDEYRARIDHDGTFNGSDMSKG